jgi:hypothetical protein
MPGLLQIREHLPCRGCRAITPHAVQVPPAVRSWTCQVCGTIERRHPRGLDEEHELMQRLGVPANRRAKQ